MITVQCPAKVNLTLKITGRRPDGFHNIESIMQTIGLYDYLTVDIKPSDRFEIKLSGNSNEIPYNEKNLVHKAAMLFVEELPHRSCKTRSSSTTAPLLLKNTTGEGYELNIYIEKHIPVAAGLAGGSTDAAGTLFALNEIFDKPFSKEELHKLCAKLGSDLNVCLEGGKLLCKGRGEIIEPLDYEEFSLSLIKPKNLGISAKEAYTKFSEKITQASSTGRENFDNDLEWAIIDDYKELQKIKELYPTSIMSGSGSTYFRLDGTFDELKEYEIYNNIKSENIGICIV